MPCSSPSCSPCQPRIHMQCRSETQKTETSECGHGKWVTRTHRNRNGESAAIYVAQRLSTTETLSHFFLPDEATKPHSKMMSKPRRTHTRAKSKRRETPQEKRIPGHEKECLKSSARTLTTQPWRGSLSSTLSSFPRARILFATRELEMQQTRKLMRNPKSWKR